MTDQFQSLELIHKLHQVCIALLLHAVDLHITPEQQVNLRQFFPNSKAEVVTIAAKTATCNLNDVIISHNCDQFITRLSVSQELSDICQMF